MKKVRLSSLPDGFKFCISDRKGSARYSLQSKKKGVAVFTSVASGRTYSRPAKQYVFIKSHQSAEGWVKE